ncbi:HEXXH motif-containing putative peptide modification protein [Streptomyces sp. NPDC006135]|uniref:aKG-HExxH-type peptide beta-hydroxylase n=1 Tax=Streptomyces sp. NPDC006135 TaxID=3154577 RepID=UPI0033EAE131
MAREFPESTPGVAGVPDAVTRAGLLSLARNVRRLPPAGVHRFYTLAGHPLDHAEGPALAELLRSGAVSGTPATVLVDTDQDWVRDGLASSLDSLHESDAEAARSLPGFPTDVRDALSRAQDALRLAWPDAWEEHNTLIRHVVFTTAQLRSATSASTFGAVYVGTHEATEALRMFEVLLHETGHHALNLREQFTRFLVNPETEAGHALRRDPRPLRGVLHAAFVLWRIEEGLRRYEAACPDGGPLDGCAWRERRAEAAGQLQQTLRALDAAAEWTTCGANLRQSLSAPVLADAAVAS